MRIAFFTADRPDMNRANANSVLASLADVKLYHGRDIAHSQHSMTSIVADYIMKAKNYDLEATIWCNVLL